MADGEKTLIEMAVQLTARLPTEMVGILNQAILQSPGAASSRARTRIAEEIPHPYYRDIALDFLKCWQNCVPLLSPQEVSLCLLTAAQAGQIYRKSQAVGLAWTGPEVEGVLLPFDDLRDKRQQYCSIRDSLGLLIEQAQAVGDQRLVVRLEAIRKEAAKKGDRTH
jgi:hypothetical protein